MDQKERSADEVAGLQIALDGHQRGIWTALPGIVQDYDPTDMTLSVQPAIQAIIVQQDPKTGQESQQAVGLPLLVKVPVAWPGGGGWSLTFPIAAGDEVLVVFACRCIDAWWQSGGVQKPIEMRAHDLSDGFAIPGIRSVPRVPGSISTTATQLRSDDGTTAISLAAGGIDIKSGGTLTFECSNATLDSSGNLALKGEVTAKSGSGSSVTLTGHEHAQGPDSRGDTEQATHAPTAGT